MSILMPAALEIALADEAQIEFDSAELLERTSKLKFWSGNEWGLWLQEQREEFGAARWAAVLVTWAKGQNTAYATNAISVLGQAGKACEMSRFALERLRSHDFVDPKLRQYLLHGYAYLDSLSSDELDEVIDDLGGDTDTRLGTLETCLKSRCDVTRLRAMSALAEGYQLVLNDPARRPNPQRLLWLLARDHSPRLVELVRACEEYDEATGNWIRRGLEGSLGHGASVKEIGEERLRDLADKLGVPFRLH